MARNNTEKGTLVRSEEPVGLKTWAFPGRPIFREFEEMRRDMDRLFGSIFGQNSLGVPAYYGFESADIMGIDLYETDEDMRLRVELPGVDQKDIDLQVTADSITISGERKADEEKQEGRYHTRQSTYGSFSRTVQLPVEVKPDCAQATMKNGILKVTLPKAQPVKPTPVKIEVE